MKIKRFNEQSENDIQTKYKHIEFILEDSRGSDPGSDVWICINHKNRDELGMVSYEPGWNQYVFNAVNDQIIFSATCLTDIAHFLKQISFNI